MHALCDIVECEFPEARRFVIIDDTIILRSSAKAPDAAVRFDHVKRANQHVLCQVLVTLSASIVLLLRSWDQVLSVSFFTPAYRLAAALTRSAFSPGSACAAP